MTGASLVRSDATAIPLGDNTVDLIVTSPPYFALRSYQDGGEHYGGQIGSEATPTAFLEALWAVTAECWRVLKPSGSLFVNLGDKYAGSNGQSGSAGQLQGGGRNGTREKVASTGGYVPETSIRPKSLMGLPWRYAIGCIDGQADPDGRGWVLRSEIVWSKPNGLPESVTDRVRRSHEQWFHLTREGRYYSNVDEVREEHPGRDQVRPEVGVSGMNRGTATGERKITANGGDLARNPLGKLPGSVWTVPTQPLIVPDWLDVDHFAAFPTEWPRRLILGWSPPGICVECGEGRRATVDKVRVGGRVRTEPDSSAVGAGVEASGHMAPGALSKFRTEATRTGESCACDKPTAPTTPAVVLDPFSGTGTVAGVARALGRYGVGCDLSADYMRLAKWRIWQSGMGARVAAKTDGERQGDLFGGAA